MRLINAGAFETLSVFWRILGAFVVAELLSMGCSHNQHLMFLDLAASLWSKHTAVNDLLYTRFII